MGIASPSELTLHLIKAASRTLLPAKPFVSKSKKITSLELIDKEFTQKRGATQQ